MSEIRIAIVGCGGYMLQDLWPVMRRLPVTPVGICDLQTERMECFTDFYADVPQYTDYISMLEEQKPDAVLCATSPKVHYEVAKACLERAIHVFVEKTPCDTATQAIELTALAQQSNCIAMVGFNRRYAVGYQQLKQILQQPEFGQPVSIYSKFHAAPYPSNHYFITNHIIHHLDLVHYLMGPISRMSLRNHILTAQTGAFMVDFETQCGAIGTIHAASLLDDRLPMELLSIVGSGGGEVTVQNMRHLIYQRPRADDSSSVGSIQSWTPNLGFTVQHLGLTEQMTDFVNAIMQNTPIRSAINESIPVLQYTEQLLAQFEQKVPRV